MFLSTSEERWAALCIEAERADIVKISTYNLYTGMGYNGKLVRSSKTWESRHFMDVINTKHTKLLVGLPPSISCVEGCEHCKNTRDRAMLRMGAHQSNWNDIDFKWQKKHHLKLYLFGVTGDSDIRWTGFTGGVNLSASEWTDVLIKLPQDQLAPALAFFNKEWHEASDNAEDFRDWNMSR